MHSPVNGLFCRWWRLQKCYLLSCVSPRWQFNTYLFSLGTVSSFLACRCEGVFLVGCGRLALCTSALTCLSGYTGLFLYSHTGNSSYLHCALALFIVLHNMTSNIYHYTHLRTTAEGGVTCFIIAQMVPFWSTVFVFFYHLLSMGNRCLFLIFYELILLTFEIN